MQPYCFLLSQSVDPANYLIIDVRTFRERTAPLHNDLRVIEIRHGAALLARLQLQTLLDDAPLLAVGAVAVPHPVARNIDSMIQLPSGAGSYLLPQASHVFLTHLRHTVRLGRLLLLGLRRPLVRTGLHLVGDILGCQVLLQTLKPN